jgi:hypothetical protein
MMQDQTASPPEDALPLRKALRQFVADDLWQAYEAATAERRKLPRRPTYFSTLIREWEAERANRTANQARSAQADMHQAWAAIKRSLINQLIAGDLTAFAQSDPPFGPWRAIPAAAWRSLHIKDVRHGRVMGPNVDMTGLHILAVDRSVEPVVRTGTQGRPKKGIHFIKAEFERRRDAGKTERSRMREAEWLLNWFLAHHADKEPPTVKTIYNNLPTGFFAPARK